MKSFLNAKEKANNFESYFMIWRGGGAERGWDDM